MAEKPWDGRFSEKTDRSVELFTSSIDIDKRLYAHDIDGSIAHCRMLGRQGIIAEEEADTLIQGLGVIKREIQRGRFEFDHALEDIHMHIETRLFQEVGKTAQKLHTARSRNDQVALDTRLYVREQTQAVIDLLVALQRVLVRLAEKHIDAIMPGYTHLQRAQPILLSHHLMAYTEMFRRDECRFSDSLKRTDVLPLGSAALAGTTYPIDRLFVAEQLHFREVSANSIDAVSDRDFVLEFLSNAAICMVHLSRLSEELVMWSSMEFGFIEISDAFATGSSIMPQKKNPDVAELVRGKTGRVFGAMIAVFTLMKSLPLAYNRDMQEDKPQLFDACDTLKACLSIMARMLPAIRFRKERMREAATRGFLNATDFADYLTAKGMAFREAHGCAGKAVAYALSQNRELDELSLEELKSISSLIGEDIYEVLKPERMIERRLSVGGTSFRNVLAAINEAQGRLGMQPDEPAMEANTSTKAAGSSAAHEETGKG
ncbi:argininosuccinate lyase [Desulfatirhabdium butyrativorans]|uniref:argininosuccinate lyase n=1 Tax=Desulfatirhabdium butyrativorans TaxID=340467 RepID=UPI0009FD2B63|nr:argininosuccinate lyase [Desulfatirhabdium butyrativorans]